MSETEIKRNFDYFQVEIKSCMMLKDINYFLLDFEDLFTDDEKRSIMDSQSNEKVNIFLSCFMRSSNPSKYKRFKKCAENYNKWILTFLSTDINDKEKLDNLKAKWAVLKYTNNLLAKLKESFVLDQVLVSHLHHKEIISTTNKDYLLAFLENNGEQSAMFELFNVLSIRDPDWYGNLLYIIAKQNSDFIRILCDDLEPMETDESYEKICLDYAKKFIDRHISAYECEELLLTIEEKNSVKSDNDEKSDYGSYDSDINDIYDLDLQIDDLEEPSVELQLKSFQLELVNEALDGINTIIYAPTGSGKTNIAVYIANHHLRNKPNGKVAFLVHRIPLVTQQYRVFKKFKDPEFKITDIRGKSDSISGPLIAHLETNDIIVMTSDIFRNALTIDDGNKLKSISEFSLIFFDECHNCMKSHPYMKIMSQYFKEKRENPSIKLPQIVGLTASPRSNKKDTIPEMKKVLFELCGNLNCYFISMVKENRKELEEFLAQPKQTVLKINNRVTDDFQTTLVKQMEYCEKKLEKMKKEKYFSPSEVRSIPFDKFRQDYVGFVGNLERLNTVTVMENDGRQKAYTIFRYLNAFYRGLTVNQMFNKEYAKKSIKKYLNHNGVDFTCSFDEEFYNNYKADVLNGDQSQSSNPAINEIVHQILTQLKQNKDSRILIFVREIDYTDYLVKILTEEWNIVAEAIVGSNAKTDFKSCTDSEIDNILARFKTGETRVLVATTVVEEGLDVALCNMVISYGHVTNETAMIQRRGRVRAMDSKYVLILPQMLHWLEKKEMINERRKEMMMQLIDQFKTISAAELKNSIEKHQTAQFSGKERKPLTMIKKDDWKFTCKSCQTKICTSLDIRIIENAHRICIIPELLNTFQIVEEPRKAFGSQSLYEYSGKILCNKCNNYPLGNYIFYRKNPFFQINIAYCNVTNINNEVKSFKKWAEFAKFYTIPDLDRDDKELYCKRLFELDLIDTNETN